MQAALDAHAQAAKQFRQAAVLLKDRSANTAQSLLLLSQTQAKSALALKRILRQQPTANDDGDEGSAKNSKNYKHHAGSSNRRLTQKDRLRAAVRGALVTKNEEEMSESAFLGKATEGSALQSSNKSTARQQQAAMATPKINNTTHNPVDDMYVERSI